MKSKKFCKVQTLGISSNVLENLHFVYSRYVDKFTEVIARM
jgi:hypothetical protein